MAADHPSLTKTEAAFRALREAIEHGRYHPGEHLRVARLVEELEMSPTPIREALRLLQSEGLVVHHAHRGTAVAEFSPEDAVEVYGLRVILEPMAAERAAVEGSPDDVAEIRRVHDELGVALQDPHRTDAADLNAAWHRAISNAAASRYLQEFIARLWQAVPVRAIWLTDRAPLSYSQHDRVTQAIEARDPRAAHACMREHIERGALSTVEHLRTLGHADPGGRAA
ncbi:GntR family transcriptional regulator [Baekduia soli]|nr:GntR family transcriptional regulator [Baekduia soli]